MQLSRWFVLTHERLIESEVILGSKRSAITVAESGYMALYRILVKRVCFLEVASCSDICTMAIRHTQRLIMLRSELFGSLLHRRGVDLEGVMIPTESPQHCSPLAFDS